MPPPLRNHHVYASLPCYADFKHYRNALAWLHRRHLERGDDGYNAALQTRLTLSSAYGKRSPPVPAHLITFTHAELNYVTSALSKRARELGVQLHLEEAWASLRREGAGVQALQLDTDSVVDAVSQQGMQRLERGATDPVYQHFVSFDQLHTHRRCLQRPDAVTMDDQQYRQLAFETSAGRGPPELTAAWYQQPAFSARLLDAAHNSVLIACCRNRTSADEEFQRLKQRAGGRQNQHRLPVLDRRQLDDHAAEDDDTAPQTPAEPERTAHRGTEERQIQGQQLEEEQEEQAFGSWRSDYLQLQLRYHELLTDHSQLSQELMQLRADQASARQLNSKEGEDESEQDEEDSSPLPYNSASVALLRDENALLKQEVADLRSALVTTALSFDSSWRREKSDTESASRTAKRPRVQVEPV